MRYSALLLLAFSSFGLTAGQQFKCFDNRDELKRAIDTCFEGDDPMTPATLVASNPNRCNNRVKRTYGWPMSTWCTGQVTDFRMLFVGKRSFNEDISTWDTSKVRARPFLYCFVASVL